MPLKEQTKGIRITPSIEEPQIKVIAINKRDLNNELTTTEKNPESILLSKKSETKLSANFKKISL